MAIHQFPASAQVFDVDGIDTEHIKRRFRWRFFCFAFVLLYIGISLDIFTTALGFLKAGSQYEANPLVSWLIGNLGWGGLAFLMTTLSWALYKSFKTVYWHMSLKWSAILNTVLLIAVVIRWLVVASAFVYIAVG